MGQLHSNYRIQRRHLAEQWAIDLLADQSPITPEWLIEIGADADNGSFHFEWFSVSPWRQASGDSWVVSPTLFVAPAPFAVVSTRGELIAFVRLVLPGCQ